jgi:PKD repeat protein
MIKQINCKGAYFLFSLILFTCIRINAQTPDPGVKGKYTVVKELYDFGDQAFQPPSFAYKVEIRGSVHYPSALTTSGTGPFPVILILHGRHESCYSSNGNTTSNWPCASTEKEIPNYDGYNFLAEQMASLGYVVISIGANSISARDNSSNDRGMAARAELIQYHLDLWKKFNSTGGTPFDTKFVGKIDFTRIGTMGHSRGGEGVVQHSLYNIEKGSPYTIKAVLCVAPTNFNRHVLTGIPVGVILPYCDGDVADLQGVHYYDDARYLDPKDNTPKHTFLMMGANHNYFNTVWTPKLFTAGTSDDWKDYTTSSAADTDPFCGASASGNKRYTDVKQRAALIAYASAFFRVYVGDEKQFAPIIETSDITPPASSQLNASDIYVSYQPPVSLRLDINREDKKKAETLNVVMDTVKENGLTDFKICGDTPANANCLALSQEEEPHTRMSQLMLQWDSKDDWYENQLPPAYKNISQFRFIQFRIAVNSVSSPKDQAPDFSIQLKDASGTVHEEKISTYSNALYFPPGTLSNCLPRILHNTVKIPVAKFNSINLSNIQSIRFLFDGSEKGAVLVSDLLLCADSIVKYAPMADFIASAVSSCDGKISFKDNSINSPVKWKWTFGDGDKSADQNPIHLYTANGTYTVKLVVENTNGADSLVKVSYITVNRPVSPAVKDDKRCGAGIVNLSATAAGGGTLTWTDASGKVVNTGTTYAPSINSTTSYFVQEEIQGKNYTGGKTSNSGGGGNYNSPNWIYFDVLKPCILKSVSVYAQGIANRTIELFDENSNLVQSKIINIADGQQTVTLDFTISPGKGYSLRVNGDINLYRNNAGVSYPYAIGDLITLTGSSAPTSPQNYYYFFYNWQVLEPSCSSTRATVTGNIIGGTVTIQTSGSTTICEDDSVTLDAGTGYTNYLWSTGALTQRIVVKNQGDYSVTTDDGKGCKGTSNIIKVVVNANPKPVIVQNGPNLNITNIPTSGVSIQWFKENVLIANVSSGSYTPKQSGNYSVIVTDGNGCKGSSTVSFFMTGIAATENERLNIYPNPSNDIVTVEYPLISDGTLQILNGLGESVKEMKFMNGSQKINTSDLSEGIYFIKLETKTGMLVRKISIVH